MPEHEVAIVMDPDFSLQLAEVASRMHVWIIDTPANRAAVERVWSAQPGISLECGVTTVSVTGPYAEGWFVQMLRLMDEHHGELSHDPPWTIVHVYGIKEIPEIMDALASYGATYQQGERQLRGVRTCHFVASRVLK